MPDQPLNRPPYTDPATDKPKRKRGALGQIDLLKWSLGCAGLAMVLFTGLTMLTVIVMPVAFRNLDGELQAKIVQRLPFMKSFQPTVPFQYLPTSVATSGNAIALLSSPVVSPTAKAITGGQLSAGSDVEENAPGANATPVPFVPSPTPPPITPVLVTDTPVVGPSPTPQAAPVQPTATLEPTLVPTQVEPPTAIPVPINFHSAGFKWVPQSWNNCGPANLTQGLQYYGWKGDQTEAATYLKPHKEDKNVSPWQMVNFVNEKTGVKAIMRVAGDLSLIKRLVSQKFAVIMETGYFVAGEGWMGHYLTVVGHDDNQRILYGLDTYLGDGPDNLGFREKYDDIDERWQHFNRLYIVIYPKEREYELATILGPDADLTYNAQHALSVAKKEASEKPNNAFAWFNMGSSLVLLGNYRDATVAFDQAWSVSPGLPYRMLWYQFTPYEAYYNVGNYANVLALAQTALQTTPYVEETYYWRGMALAAQGKSKSAIEDFKKVLQFNPNFAPAADKLAAVQNGNFKPPVVAQAGQ
ncbi:MAG: tetratricopeptide repeat protein [Anaerolineae bacterium]|nr:tetratricopeptide repeat protein [Anaerolineae bacterium]